MKFFTLIPTNTKIDFIGKFKYFFALSLVTFVFVIWKVSTGGLNFGVDFTGGTVIQARFNKAQNAESVRKIIAELGEGEASVVSLGTENTDYLITSRSHADNDESGKNLLNQKLTQKLGSDVQILSVDVVGPKVGAELKKAAILSLVYSILLIAAYIWLRFDFRFAPGATIAMVHDLIMATGFYLLTGREFTITAIAALLTIAGYSVNDTIVIYDRVREMNKAGGNALPLPETINKAINLTLSRTILTAALTLISVIPIAIFCTGELQSFALAMCFGIFVGIYSTIYIASPFTIYVAKFLENKEQTRTTSRTAKVKA
ncbi:MAG: protein translocase subunit SecF [Pseudomonadota bacterium]